MKDSQHEEREHFQNIKYIKANNERFSTQTKNIDVEG